MANQRPQSRSFNHANVESQISACLPHPSSSIIHHALICRISLNAVLHHASCSMLHAPCLTTASAGLSSSIVNVRTRIETTMMQQRNQAAMLSCSMLLCSMLLCSMLHASCSIYPLSPEHQSLIVVDASGDDDNGSCWMSLDSGHLDGF